MEFEGPHSYHEKISSDNENSKLNDNEIYKKFLNKKFEVFLEILKGFILSDIKMNKLQVIFYESFKKVINNFEGPLIKNIFGTWSISFRIMH